MEENKHRIPNQLVLLRKRMNLSQKRVARIIGLRDATLLSRYEGGREAPPLKTALKLAALYDVPLPEIFRELSVRARTQVFGPDTKDTGHQRSASHEGSGRTN
jgi:transcriptional regulator with XRE-family HTH domain